MKKLNKLCAILFAMLGVGTLSAQTDVTDQYLTNADFSSTDGWTAYVSSQFRDYGQGNIGGSFASYAASTTDATHLSSERFFGFQCRWNGNYASYNQETSTELPMGVYTLSFDVENVNGSTTAATYNNLFYVKVGDNTITDPSTEWMNGKSNWTSHSITFIITEATKATVSLGYGTGTNNFATGNTPVLYVSHLKLTYKTFQDVTPENPVDLTSMVSNTQSAWTGATECPNYDGISMPAVYKSSDWTGDALSQTINGLPVGKYEMEAYCQAHSSWDADAAAEGAIGYTYLCANEYKLDVPIRNADGATTKLLHTFEDMSITGGTLKISVVNEQLAANWLQIYVKSLTFLGPDKTLYEEAFNTRYTSLSALDTEAVPSAFATKITDLKTQYNVEATTLTLSQLEEANAAMDVLLNSYEGVAAAYANIKSLITLCETYAAEDYSIVETDGVRTTFTSAIATAKTDADAATSASELNTVYNTLESARQTYVTEAYPTAGNSFDMTYKILNAEVASKDSWTTNANLASNVQYDEAPDVFALDLWHWGAMDVYANQAINNLPNGVYTLTAMARTNGADMCYVYATNNEVEYKEVVPGDANWSLVTVSNIVVNKDASITLGLKGSINNTWFSVDNFKLYRAYDASVLSSLLEEANTIITASEPMNAAVKEELTDAISSADIEATEPVELDNMVSNLITAIANAEASIADYALIRKYIDKAKVFDADAAELAAMETKYTNGEFTAVEPVRQALNVWTANYVAANFKNEILLTEWSAASNPMWSTSGEHWDGTTGEGCTSYYDANGTNTAHTLSKTVDLIPGTYVFRGAGRSNTNTKLSLSIDIEGIEPVVFNAKGNTGYGIATDGTATFDPEAQYARNDQGQGWEWEFIKFTLTENTSVTLTATCETTGWGWASFANNGLWMDDATYVTVYGKELDDPLAEAKALVDTKPMGTAENTALANAIAQGEGTISTPAELNAAVDDLKTAVANANAWRETYYAEKDKLVAALERFEADYNDAENGALDHMAKSRWETVITKAQAAAVAKDDLTSHEVLTTATTELTAALDAATVSVNEYAALDEAIKAAAALANGINWGDQPFQRPESAKAGLDTTDEQAVYNAAEADGEGVTSVTEALNAAMDIPLNVPEGDFYLTVATEGHKYLNKIVFASLGATGDNNPTGYVFNTTGITADTHKFTFEQVEGNLYRISVEVGGEKVYLTTGSLNGSAAGWNLSQIQGTTDAEKVATFKIEASPAVEGAFRIYNTEANAYVDCQDGGNIYTDTNIQNEDFAIVDEYLVSTDINISAENKVSTCVLMFDAEIPEELTVYVGEEHAGDYMIFKVFEGTTLPAYTPCLLYAENGYEGTWEGEVVLDKYEATVTGEDGVYYGAIEDQTISAGYVLQKKDTEEVAKFYNINGREGTIPAGKCWLNVTTTTDAATVTCLFRGGIANNIDEVMVDKTTPDGAIYTLDGKRVSRMERGKIYIINGQKIMVK